MATIHHRDPKSGTVYVYSSKNYWDKEAKKYRSHRKLIGKIDPATGEVVPTGRVGRPKKYPDGDEDTKKSDTAIAKLEKELDESRKTITDLSVENERLLDTLQKITRFLTAELKEFIHP